MCGIAGVVTAGRPLAGSTDVARVLAAALAHRGPDGEGTWTSPAGDALLVHRRLAIIDPGPDGAQPMSYSNGRYQITVNGEGYNYRELRRAAQARGRRSTTNGETEVPLAVSAH